jgi:hypothetical protein
MKIEGSIKISMKGTVRKVGDLTNIGSTGWTFQSLMGENPTNWLYKPTQYFDFNQIQGMDRILIASFHMEGEALIWFQEAEFSGLINTWDTFAKACLVRFGPTAYDDPMESPTRLRQTHYVVAYKAQFEALSNRLRGLTEPYKLSCFLSGLKDDIRLAVRMLASTSLGQAFGLATIQEKYVLSFRKAIRFFWFFSLWQIDNLWLVQ